MKIPAGSPPPEFGKRGEEETVSIRALISVRRGVPLNWYVEKEEEGEGRNFWKGSWPYTLLNFFCLSLILLGSYRVGKKGSVVSGKRGVDSRVRACVVSPARCRR